MGILAVAGLAGTPPAWTPPREVRGFPERRLLRQPVVARLGDTLFVVGNTVPLAFTDLLDARLGSLVREPGGAVPLPPGEFQFAHPKITMDERGTLHLIWAELARPARRLPDLGREPIALWHATYSSGTWSPPERVLTATSIGWDDARGTIGIDRIGGLHIAVPAALTPGPDRLVYLRLHHGRWSQRAFPDASAYASVSASGRSIIVAFVGSDSGATASGLFTRESLDGGDSWTAPQLVEPGGRFDLGDPRVFGDTHSTTLVWSARPRGHFEIAELHSALAARAGRAWVVKPPVALPAGSMAFDVVHAECGQTVAIVQTLNDNPRRLDLEDIDLPNGKSYPFEPSRLRGSRDAALSTNGRRLDMVFSAFKDSSSSLMTWIASRPICAT